MIDYNPFGNNTVDYRYSRPKMHPALSGSRISNFINAQKDDRIPAEYDRVRYKAVVLALDEVLNNF